MIINFRFISHNYGIILFRFRFLLLDVAAFRASYFLSIPHDTSNGCNELFTVLYEIFNKGWRTTINRITISAKVFI